MDVVEVFGWRKVRIGIQHTADGASVMYVPSSSVALKKSQQMLITVLGKEEKKKKS